MMTLLAADLNAAGDASRNILRPSSMTSDGSIRVPFANTPVLAFRPTLRLKDKCGACGDGETSGCAL